MKESWPTRLWLKTTTTYGIQNKHQPKNLSTEVFLKSIRISCVTYCLYHTFYTVSFQRNPRLHQPYNSGLLAFNIKQASISLQTEKPCSIGKTESPQKVTFCKIPHSFWSQFLELICLETPGHHFGNPCSPFRKPQSQVCPHPCCK